MKINYAEIPDKWPALQNPPVKGLGRQFCLSCRKTLDEKQFFKTSRLNKFTNGFLPHCKTCTTLTVNDTDPATFLSILKEVDVPYIPSEWRALVVKKDPKGSSVLGKYLSKMKLSQFKKYSWADSEKLAADEESSILAALRQESNSETEAETKLQEMMSMTDLPAYRPGVSLNETTSSVAALYGLIPENSKYGLTQEEINQLKITWGSNYDEDGFLFLEQLFNDMKQSYVITDPLAISNAKIICKMTQKLNSVLDIDDIESATKISRQLDLFIKSANLAPVQSKERSINTFAISQLAYLIEREGGFIPDFYDGTPNDKIDQVLQDMQEYTEYLVKGESNISEMAKNTAEILAQDALPNAVEDYDDFAALEAELLGDIEEMDGE